MWAHKKFLHFPTLMRHNFVFYNCLAMKFSALIKRLVCFIIQVIPVLRYGMLCGMVWFVPTCPIFAGPVTFVLLCLKSLWLLSRLLPYQDYSRTHGSCYYYQISKVCLFGNSSHTANTHLDRQPDCTTLGTPSKPFIDHYVCEILSAVNCSFTQSADNPANLLKRGISTNQIRQSHLYMWTQGPHWLLTKSD